jgi:hypothetical protein
MSRWSAPLAAAACALSLSLAARADTFSYLPPGDLIEGSGDGRVDEIIYAPGMRFPIEAGPAFANSQVYNKGGYQGPAGGQCDDTNYAYPWQDNYCEIRTWEMPLCPAGTGHQGQDIRPATCEAGVHWAVAAADGTITNVGNYSVYLTGKDGTRYDYLHMSDVQVAVGEDVVRGEHMGRVSNMFGGTPTTIHLHFNLRQNVSGVGDVYVPPYTSLIAAYQVLINAPPEGSLDAAECDGIRGWTRDPDAPDAPGDARLTFDGAAEEPGVESHTIRADLRRDDLCAALGSCEHGFAAPVPLSLLGSGEHGVHAYGADNLGGPDAELAGSPKSFTCALVVPDGVRRLVGSPATMEAWRFSSFWDVASVDDATIDRLPEGLDLPPAPLLEQADDGTPDIWLLDSGFRRQVPSPDVAAAWELDLAAKEVLPAADLEKLPKGAPLRPRPFLVQGSGPEIYLIDDPPGLAADDLAPDGADVEGTISCTCDASGAGGAAPPWALALAALCAALRARAQRRSSA